MIKKQTSLTILCLIIGIALLLVAINLLTSHITRVEDTHTQRNQAPAKKVIEWYYSNESETQNESYITNNEGYTTTEEENTTETERLQKSQN